jgi:hypothetical protein
MLALSGRAVPSIPAGPASTLARAVARAHHRPLMRIARRAFVTMAHLDRVHRLEELQGDHTLERELLDGEISSYDVHQTAAAGINSTYHVELGELEAFHKPHAGVVARVARDFGHSFDTPPICECAAWPLAKRFGDPFDRLVPVTVYRRAGRPEDDPGSWEYGSLSRKHEGEPFKGSAVKTEAYEDALAAGFFDALIRNQDRHAGQFRWHSETNSLGLIDHGFSFPTEAALCRGAYFQDFRRRERRGLTQHEREILRYFAEDTDLWGLAAVLEPDRATRLRWRARRIWSWTSYC